MAGSLRSAKAYRLMLELLLLWLCSVAVAKKKEGEWGEWGDCSPTCGIGQRSREGCKKQVKAEKTCPPGHQTTETEDCRSTVYCSLSSFNTQAPTSSSLAMSSTLYIMTSSATLAPPLSRSPLVLTSSALVMTSTSAEVMSSTQFNQVLQRRRRSAASSTTASKSKKNKNASKSKSIKGEWGVWGACSPTCGSGQKSREGCKKKVKKGSSTCKSRDVTKQTKDCSNTACILSSVITQALSSPIEKTSIVMIAPTSLPLALTSSSYLTTPSVVLSPLISSSTLTSSAPVVTVSSSQFNQVLQSSKAASRLLTSSITESTPGLITSNNMISSLVITSNQVSESTPGQITSNIMTSSLMMTSTFVSVMSPTKSNQVSHKSLSTNQQPESTPGLMTSNIMTSSLAMTPLVMTSSSVSVMSPTKSNQVPHKSLSSRQAYFNTAKKDWVLHNHVIKDIWTPSEITCAMYCLREQNCQSFNFKCTAKDSIRVKNANKIKNPNCQLNSAKHSAHPRDFSPKKGFCYFYLI